MDREQSIEEVEDRLMDRLYELPDKHGAGTSTLSPSHGQQNIAVSVRDLRLLRSIQMPSVKTVRCVARAP